MHGFCGVVGCWRSVLFDIGKDRRQCPGDYSIALLFRLERAFAALECVRRLKINPKNMGESMVGARSKPRAVENRE